MRPRLLWAVGTPLVLISLTVAAWTAASHARIDWNLHAPLLPFRAGVEPVATPRRQVLLVVIDGLGAEEAKRLPGLGALAKRGAAADIWADGPTFSSAQYVALLTGVPPIDSGIRNNSDIHHVALDSVPAAFRRQGRTAAVASDDVDWWQRLLEPAWTEAAQVAPGELIRWSQQHLSADFLLVHFCAVDEAGHRSGAASQDYRDAARDVDRDVAELAKAWRGPGHVLGVVADHGHVAYGGHGGDEDVVRHTWMVLSGEGVKPGAAVTGSALDVAPTLAALGGVSAPGTAEGRTLTALLSAPAATLARWCAADAERLAQVLALAGSARAVDVRHERFDQVWRAGCVLLLAAAALYALRRAGPLAETGAVAGLAALGATAVGQWLLWGVPSPSGARLIGLVIQNVGFLSFGCSAVALLGLGRRGLRGGFVDACHLSGGFALGAAPLALGTFIDAGAFVPRFTCLPAWREVLPMAAYAAWGAALIVAVVPLLGAGVRALTHALRASPGRVETRPNSE